MGSLYECLREARLEKFYPTLRANGFSSAESLIELSGEDVSALGNVTEDEQRRLFELVDIIRSVYEVDVEDLPDISEATAYSVSLPIHRHSQSKNKPARKRNRSPQYTSSASNILPRQSSAESQRSRHSVRRHVSAPSVPRPRLAFEPLEAAAYPDDSDSSNDDANSDSSGPSDYEPATKHVNRASATPPRPRRVTTIERVKHTTGYNYGLPKNKVKQKPTAVREDASDHKICVCVRKRPRNKREIRSADDDVVVVERSDTITINEPKLAVDLRPYTLQHEFCFDEVFHEGCGNEEVFERAAKPLIDCVFQGGSATCFAYGQTGAGKTHTMLGTREQPGLYMLAAQEIFSISQSGQYGSGLMVWVSFFEIYCGQLFDLLNKRNRLHAREDGSHRVCIAGLTETQVTDVPSIMQVLEYGNQVRSKGSTGVNPDSSRSHAVLQVEVRTSADRRLGRMSFIDLAGSERAADVTDTDRQTRLEGAEINQSLLALKECIRSIDQENRHTPFRQSKLTHILKDSFIGNSRTCMIANVSPTYSACENSLNTLRYADRVKELRKAANQNLRVSRSTAQPDLNVPFITPPSIFHPSNIACSSTPLRPRPSRKQVGRRSPPATVLPDPSETPIRGNFPGQRKTSRESGRASSSSSTLRRSKSLFCRQSAPMTPAVQREKIDVPTRSSSESNPTLSDTCNLNVLDNDLSRPQVRRHEPLAASNDTEPDVAAEDLEEIGQELNDLNKTGGKSDSVMPGFAGIVDVEVPSESRTISSAESRGQQVSCSQRTSMNVPEVAGAEFSQPSAIAFSTSISLRDSSSYKPKPLVLRRKPTDFCDEDETSVKGQDSSRSDTDDLLFGSPKENQLGGQSKPKVTRDGEDENYQGYLTQQHHPSAAEGALGKVQGASTPRRAEFLPQASPAKSSDLTSFSRSENVRLRAHPVCPELQYADPDPVRILATDHFVLQDDIQAGLFAEEMFPREILTTPAENKDVPSYPSDRNDLSRREKTDPLLARHRARQNMPNPSEFLKHLTKQSLAKPTAVPSPVVANIPLPVLPTSDEPNALSSVLIGVAQPTNRVDNAHQRSSSQRQPDSLSDYETDMKRIPSLGSVRSLGTPSPNSTESPGRKHSDGSAPGSLSPVDQRKRSSEARQRRRSRSNSRDRDQRKKSASPASDPSPAAFNLAMPADSSSAIKPVPSNVESLGYAHKAESYPSSSAGELFQSVGVPYLPISGDYIIPSQELPAPSQPSVLQSFSGTSDDIQIPNINADPAYNVSDRLDIDTQLSTAIKPTEPVKNSPTVVGAITTEKLSTFSPAAGFAPIHPQPVTEDRARHSAPKGISRDVIPARAHPLAVSSSTSGSIMRATSNLQRLATIGIPADPLAAKVHIVTAHEEQLAAITSLCKQEMKLLLAFRAGHKDTEEYIKRMGDILSLKMKTVNLLQDQIGELATTRGRSQNSGVNEGQL